MPENKLKITSTVVVSQSFLKEQKRREKAKERRLNRFRRSRSESDDEGARRDREDRRRHSDREVIRRGRRDSDKDENEDRVLQRDRNSGRFRAERASATQHNSVFDRLDKGSIKSRLGPREVQEDREGEEAEKDPTDVPKGNRYFMHDDRDGQRGRGGNRRQPMLRARSRSPVWKHDMFNKIQRELKDREEARNVRRGEETRNVRREPSRRARSPMKWKHDMFEQLEEETKKETERQERKSRRRSKDRE